jgi:hypothetical protein
MYRIQHINEKKNMLISRTREKSAVGDSVDSNSRVLQRAAYFSCCASISMDADISPGTRILIGARILPSPYFSLGARNLPYA